MNYENYSTEELASDLSFQRWLGRKHPDDTAFWDAWIAAHPEKKEVVSHAASLVQQLRFRKMDVPNEYVAQDWAALEAVLNPITLPLATPLRAMSRPYLRWAAVMGGLLMLATAAYLMLRPAPNAMMAYQTGYGETLEIRLPDSSTIVLNANSRLSFAREWQPETVREVKLEGEAYFDVRRFPQAARSPFRVHTGSITVEVLGTRFNVIDRAGAAEVVLNSGKVQLSHRLSGDTLTMAPGEMVRVSQSEKSFVKKVVNPEVYSSWTENRWIFDATTIGEIASRIQATYGVVVRVPSEQLRARELSGAITIENLEFLMEALSTSFDIDITREGDTLVFRENP